MMPSERVTVFDQALGRRRAENVNDLPRQPVAHLNRRLGRGSDRDAKAPEQMLLRIVLMPEPQRESRAFAGRPGFFQAKHGLAWLVVIEVLFPDAPAGLGIAIDRAGHRQAVLVELRNSAGERQGLEFTRPAPGADAH